MSLLHSLGAESAEAGEVHAVRAQWFRLGEIVTVRRAVSYGFDASFDINEDRL